MPMRTIASAAGCSVAIISHFLATLGRPCLKALEPASPVVRSQRSAPIDVSHINTKKFGRIVPPTHQVTGNRHDSIGG